MGVSEFCCHLVETTIWGFFPCYLVFCPLLFCLFLDFSICTRLLFCGPFSFLSTPLFVLSSFIPSFIILSFSLIPYPLFCFVFLLLSFSPYVFFPPFVPTSPFPSFFFLPFFVLLLSLANIFPFVIIIVFLLCFHFSSSPFPLPLFLLFHATPLCLFG